jgi:hypothetical protein
MVIGYRGVAVGAAAYDSSSGVGIFVLPTQAPKLKRGKNPAVVAVSDFQEAKNVATFGPNVMPNTRFRRGTIRAVQGTTATWLLPRGGCVRGSSELLVLANSTGKVSAVRFYDGRRLIGIDRTGVAGLYTLSWRARHARKGPHRLRAVADPARGRAAVASRVVRVCR